MSFNSRTYSDCCLIVLDSPNSGHAHAEIKTVLRNQIKLYRNAPHGYYIGQDAQGNRYLFSFVSGNDIVKAFHDALVAQTAPKSPQINMSTTRRRANNQITPIATIMHSVPSLECNPPEWPDQRNIPVSRRHHNIFDTVTCIPCFLCKKSTSGLVCHFKDVVT
ncbi:hypothetical protein C8J55DRAFT_529442 [Lentinula edodes]|uniref:Uncharacterized protein n=1 Tax=Lentinula lateritia TaxID=40482 RepID=A0A9W9DE91_9AGAR|nr:hypothetical protein C8J55DRAFT_529442 [Lentinula edodes]